MPLEETKAVFKHTSKPRELRLCINIKQIPKRITDIWVYNRFKSMSIEDWRFWMFKHNVKMRQWEKRMCFHRKKAINQTNISNSLRTSTLAKKFKVPILWNRILWSTFNSLWFDYDQSKWLIYVRP